MENGDGYLRAKKRVENLKAFYIHLMVYILVNVMLIAINLLTDSSYWWFLYPLGGWGIGILIHGITILAQGNFGSEWEERKIKEYMEKDKKNG
ncbi:2TM domain-containing protein [Peribacillus frigoritolerans]|uniref:2TM domain-containing protein n=1 Tax=Peribacillus frigoritolerans TaxID=450367 RepID=UPI0038082E99